VNVLLAGQESCVMLRKFLVKLLQMQGAPPFLVFAKMEVNVEILEHLIHVTALKASGAPIANMNQMPALQIPASTEPLVKIFGLILCALVHLATWEINVNLI